MICSNKERITLRSMNLINFYMFGLLLVCVLIVKYKPYSNGMYVLKHYRMNFNTILILLIFLFSCLLFFDTITPLIFSFNYSVIFFYSLFFRIFNLFKFINFYLLICYHLYSLYKYHSYSVYKLMNFYQLL